MSLKLLFETSFSLSHITNDHICQFQNLKLGKDFDVNIILIKAITDLGIGVNDIIVEQHSKIKPTCKQFLRLDSQFSSHRP